MLEAQYLRSIPRPAGDLALHPHKAPLLWRCVLANGLEIDVCPDWWESTGGSMRTVGLPPDDEPPTANLGARGDSS